MMIYFPRTQHSDKPAMGQKRNQGQIVVEYVLLLVVTIIIAVALTKGLVGTSGDAPDEQGVIVQKWYQLISIIGSDRADSVD